MEIKHLTLKQTIVKEEITRKFRRYLETNENKNTTYQNICDEAEAVLRGKFIAINN